MAGAGQRAAAGTASLRSITRSIRAQTRELRQLGSIGYIRGIHARLDSLERDAPGDAPYIGQLRRLVSDFQIDAFMEALGPELDDG